MTVVRLIVVALAVASATVAVAEEDNPFLNPAPSGRSSSTGSSGSRSSSDNPFLDPAPSPSRGPGRSEDNPFLRPAPTGRSDDPSPPVEKSERRGISDSCVNWTSTCEKDRRIVLECLQRNPVSAAFVCDGAQSNTNDACLRAQNACGENSDSGLGGGRIGSFGNVPQSSTPSRAPGNNSTIRMK